MAEVQDDWDNDADENEEEDNYQQQQQQQQGDDYAEENDVAAAENNNSNYNQYGLEDDEEDEEGDDILDLDQDEVHHQASDRPDALLMRFCPHDSSMLYPQEHKRSRTLKYACRICRYSEDAKNPLIYRNVLKKEVGNVLHTVPGTVSDDPTLSRSQNASCKSCGHNEAVFFQSDTSDVRSDTLKLIFVCCNCNHKWVA